MKNYEVYLPKTQLDLDQRLYLPRTIYGKSAKIRFNKLNRDYILRKGEEELFPIIGNYQLGIELSEYYRINYERLSHQNKIKIIDVGAAGGALTSMFALNSAIDFRLDNKIDLHLVDVAYDALQSTINKNINYPKSILAKYKVSKSKLIRIAKIISKAQMHVASAIALPNEVYDADVSLSGFTHHHMNIQDKQKACQEMLAATKHQGFIGISDEHLTLKQYQKWYKEHVNEKNSRGEYVPIAMESFIELEEHIRFFKGEIINVKTYPKTRTQTQHYTFTGVKK